MLSATLGGLIKDYRLKKRLSQLEVSLRIGWSDTTRLSKIEQGRVGKPTRETIEKVIKALDLNEQEKGEFLYQGGYLPSDEEIKAIIKEFAKKIDSWPYPAYMMDLSWRLLYCNPLSLIAFNLPLSWLKDVPIYKPNVLEFPFLPKDQYPVDVEKGEDIKSLKSFQLAQIANFKTENFRYQKETWYKRIVQNMMKSEEFRDLWFTVSLKEYYKKLLDHEYKRITGVFEGKKKSLDFYLSTTKLIEDPRFQICFYFPANPDSLKFCIKNNLK
jgi:transcriptional regulator with XRE-family HTH domain